MAFSRLLEEFETPAPRTAPAAPEHSPGPPIDPEEIRARAYESGYSCGWDDASKAAGEQRAKVDAEFERCVEDLGFTFHEAAAQLRAEFSDLVAAMLDQFFPAILPELLRETVREELLKAGEPLLEPAIVLMASSDTMPFFEDMAAERDVIAFDVVEEPTLGPNQAFLKFRDREVLADFGPLIETTRAQLAALRQGETPEARHG